jgi:hypothetical protein
MLAMSDPLDDDVSIDELAVCTPMHFGAPISIWPSKP